MMVQKLLKVGSYGKLDVLFNMSTSKHYLKKKSFNRKLIFKNLVSRDLRAAKTVTLGFTMTDYLLSTRFQRKSDLLVGGPSSLVMNIRFIQKFLYFFFFHYPYLLIYWEATPWKDTRKNKRKRDCICGKLRTLSLEISSL